VFKHKIGSGGFGSVFLARAPNGVDVAVKVIDINQSPEIGTKLVDSYLNEISMMNRLREESKHVVKIYDFDFDARSGKGSDLLIDMLTNLKVIIFLSF